MSPDNGANWTTYNTNLTNENIITIVGNAINIFLGTDGNGYFGGGAWKWLLSDIPLTFSIKEIKAHKSTICVGDSADLIVSAAGGTPPFQYL
jgi:hypothetical protein